MKTKAITKKILSYLLSIGMMLSLIANTSPKAAAVSYGTNLIPTLTSGSLSSQGWGRSSTSQINANTVYEGGVYKIMADGVGDDVGDGTGNQTGAYFDITLTAEDRVRADKGDLTVSASGKFWHQTASTIKAHIRVDAYDSSWKLIGNKVEKVDDFGSDDKTLNLSGYTIPVGTYYLRLWYSNHNSLAGRPSIWNMSCYIYDNTAPSLLIPSSFANNITPTLVSIPSGMTYIAASSDSSYYKYPAGTTVNIGVALSEAIAAVNSYGTLATNVGNAVGSNYQTAGGRSTVNYTFTIPNSGTISDSHEIIITSLSGLSVRDHAGNTASSLGGSGNKKTNMYMDNRAPESAGMTVEGASVNSCLKAGDQISFKVKFHEYVYSDGRAKINLSNGKAAVAAVIDSSRTSTDTIPFTYTVAAGDDCSSLNISSINFTGITDYVGQPAGQSSQNSSNMYNSILSSYNLKIDTAGAAVDFENPSDTWHNSSYEARFTVTDNVVSGVTGSGADEIYSKWTAADSAAPVFGATPDIGSPDESGFYSAALPAASGRHNLWLKIYDKAGNISEERSPYTYLLDFTEPEITITPAYVTDTSILKSITASVSDIHSGLDTVTYVWRNSEGVELESGNVPEDGSIPLPAEDGIYKLSVSAADRAGNTASVTTGLYEMDLTPPTAAFTPNGSSDWAKSHSVTVNLEDSITGVHSWHYQWSASAEQPDLNGSGWTPGDAPVLTSPQGVSGSYYLHIKAEDNRGNKAVYTSAAYMVDNIGPDVSISPDGNAGNIGRSSYSVGISVTDGVSPLSDIVLSYALSADPDGEDLTYSPLEYDMGYDITIGTISEDTYLFVKAADKAGNETAVRSNVFTADREAPVGSITNNGSQYINTASIELNFSASDNYSSIDSLEMRVSVDGNEGAWESYVTSKTLSFSPIEGSHNIAVSYRDESGNVSEAYSAAFVYDITPPEIDISYSNTAPTNGNVTAYAITADTLIGSGEYVFTSNGEHTFNAVDAAGNSSSRTASVSWIDKTAPTVGITSDYFDARPHRSVSVNISAADVANGVALVEYRFVQDKGDTVTAWLVKESEDCLYLNNTDGLWYLQARAVDGVGNLSNVVTSDALYLDNTAPTATAVYSPSSTRRTAQNVTANISFNEPATVTNNGGSTEYTFADNGSFTYEFTDEAGNSGTFTAVVDWIDRNAPQATVNQFDLGGNKVISGTWVNYDLKITVISPDECTIDSIYWLADDTDATLLPVYEFGEGFNPDNGALFGISDDSGSFICTRHGTLVYKMHDNETGIQGEGEFRVLIDKEAPVFTSEQRSSSVWTNQDVTVTVSAADRLSGVSYPQGSSHVFTENGSHTFYFTDAAGNIGSHTLTVANIDKAVPTAHVSYKTADGKNYLTSGWTNQNVTARLELDSLSPAHITNNNGSREYTFTSDGSFTFEFADEAGNTGECTVIIDKIDKNAPTGYVTLRPKGMEDDYYGWTNRDVIATLHASDDDSGADDMSCTFTENGSYTFVLYDNAGNSTEITASTDRIDKKAPVISVTLNPSSKTPFAVYATATADEYVTWANDIKSMKYTSNTTAETAFTFTATDRAGNTSAYTPVIDFIDNSLPEVRLVYSTSTATNKSVYVTLETVNPEDSIYIKNNGGSATYVFDRNGVFTFNYLSASGVSGEITSQVSWIDKAVPVITAAYSVGSLTNGDVKVSLSSDKAVTWPKGVTTDENGNASYTFKENGAVLISAADALGNKGSAVLKVDYIDKTPPAITVGEEYVTLKIGAVFDPMEGVSCSDASGIPDGLKIDGSVDTEQAGLYTLTYTAADSAGNTSTAYKYVTVYDPSAFNLIINGRIPGGGSVTIPGGDLKLDTINAEGEVTIKLLTGKKNIGDFKKKGTYINKNHSFSDRGWYTLYVSDSERSSQLVYVYADKEM